MSPIKMRAPGGRETLKENNSSSIYWTRANGKRKVGAYARMLNHDKASGGPKSGTEERKRVKAAGTFPTRLVGCQTLPGEMDDKIWLEHTRDQFKSVLDVQRLVRKRTMLIVGRKRIVLYPESGKQDKKARQQTPILNHQVKFITHTYHSKTHQLISYIYKLSRASHQLICIEAGEDAGVIMERMRKFIKGSELAQTSFDERDTAEEPSETLAGFGAADDTGENESVLTIEISSDDDSDADSDVEIIDMQPQIPFRNHTLENIDV